MSGWSLFTKECRRVVTGLPFWLLVAALLAFLSTQFMAGLKPLEEPQPGLASYGASDRVDWEKAVPAALQSLAEEYGENRYKTYPFGFVKTVRLKEEGRERMGELLSELTGRSEEELAAAAQPAGFAVGGGERQPDGSFAVQVPQGEEATPSLTLAPGLAREDFVRLMGEADELLGGGSSYAAEKLAGFGREPLRYEEALEQYRQMVEEDRVTGAYARLFCDYMGIPLAVLPAFVAAALWLKDRRAGAREAVWSRRVSSLALTAARFGAVIAAVMGAVLVLAGWMTAVVLAKNGDLSGSLTAFFSYSLGWLLPGVLVSAGVGAFLTECTDTPIAIFVQGAWWYLSLFAGAGDLVGGYGWSLLIRHNRLGGYAEYRAGLAQIAANRLVYALAGLLLMLLTGLVLEQKRRGRFGGMGKALRVHRRCQRAAV
ncbi:hypothetical protein LJB68_04385 [bacterium 210820-DFI.6.52]|nr:hypothetical protein [bacterium 210820-DFI.6.52]